MSKYIDYDKVLDKLAGYLWIDSWESPYPSDDMDEHYAHAKEMLKDFEMIDIVRCKDCKHSRCAYPMICHLGKALTIVESGDCFCSYGKRKDK